MASKSREDAGVRPRSFQCQMERMRGAIVIKGNRVTFGSRFMKWAEGKHVDTVRRWLRDKGVSVIETDYIQPSKYGIVTPDKWLPVSWYRADPMGLVFGFQGDTVTRCNDHAFIGEDRAAMRGFLSAEDQTVSYIGTGLREYVIWEDDDSISIGLNPKSSTVYASLRKKRQSDTEN